MLLNFKFTKSSSQTFFKQIICYNIQNFIVTLQQKYKVLMINSLHNTSTSYSNFNNIFIIYHYDRFYHAL